VGTEDDKMVTGIKSKYVVDDNGKTVSVLLDIKAYGKLLAELEELESIRAFDAAKASGEKPVKFKSSLARGKKSGR
jgi:hypothetical protein